MKKLYFLLVAMMVSFAAGAVSETGYVIAGAVNSWALNNPDYKFTDQGDGTYTITLASLPSGFKIKSAENKWNDAENYGATSASAKCTIGKQMKLINGNGGKDINFTGNITAANVKLTFNPTALTLLAEGVEKEVETTYVIWGCLTSSEWGGVPFVKGSATTWTASLSVSYKNAEFGIRELGDDLQTAWISAVAETTISGNTTLSLSNDGSHNIKIIPGQYEFTYDSSKMKLTVVAKTTGEYYPECTVYFDNTATNWASVCVNAYDKDGAELLSYSEMDATGVDGIFKTVVPEGTKTVSFNDGDEAETPDYTAKDSYIYSMTNSGEAYSEPIDASSWYFNLTGSFNNWGDNGVKLVDGVATWVVSKYKNGSDGFKIKVYDGSADIYISTASEISLGTPADLTFDDRQYGNMTVANADGKDLKFTWNFETGKLLVEEFTIDYSTWWINVVGDFNNWESYDGAQIDENGVASITVNNVGATGFKIKIYDGISDKYFSNGSAIVADVWTLVPGSAEACMTLPADLQSGKVTISYNPATNEIQVSKAAAEVPGDANGDGEVDITDAQSVIDALLAGANCDLNGDGETNISDAQFVIDIMLGGAN